MNSEFLAYAVLICGVYCAAYAIIDQHYIYPRWRRWALIFGGLAMIATPLATHTIPPAKPGDNAADYNAPEYP